MASCCICRNEFNGTAWQYDQASGERCHVDCAATPPLKPELKVAGDGATAPFGASRQRARAAVRNQKQARRRNPNQRPPRTFAPPRRRPVIVDNAGNYPDMIWTKR